MKSMWSGTITFGMVSVPVKMYKGSDERSAGLHLICKCHREQITKRDRCAVDEHILTQTEKSHAVMGPQGWVEITDADMLDLPLRTMHTIEIDAFVPQDLVPLATHANSMYYLEPNDPAKLGSAKPYALLREVLSSSGYYAVGRLGMRDKEQLCALSVQSNAITVTTLTWPELIRDTKELRLPTDAPSPEEVKLAMTLVNGMYGDWDASAYQDAYRPALERLIASKAAGQPVPSKKAAAPVTNDLVSQLKASVAAQSGKSVSKKKRAS